MMDQEFELSNTDRFGALLVHKEQLAKSHAYHLRIRPSEAGPIEKRRAQAVAKARAAAQAKAKAPTPEEDQPVSVAGIFSP